MLSRSVTPQVVSRLPNIRQAMRGAAEGTSRATKMVTTMGKKIFSFRETGRSSFMTMARSFLVVSSLIMGG